MGRYTDVSGMAAVRVTVNSSDGVVRWKPGSGCRCAAEVVMQRSVHLCGAMQPCRKTAPIRAFVQQLVVGRKRFPTDAE